MAPGDEARGSGGVQGHPWIRKKLSMRSRLAERLSPFRNTGWNDVTEDITAEEPWGILRGGRGCVSPAQPPMSVVKSIEVVLPQDSVYLAGSNIDGQVVLTLNSTLVDPVVKVELVGRGYVEWNEEIGETRDYSRDVICNNKADYVHKTKTFPIKDNWLRAGSHTFDFHFNLPPRLPSTFNSKIGHISYFVQALCMGQEHILAKKKLYLLVQGISEFRHWNLSENPVSVEAEKKVSYNCCSQGWVSLHVQMNKNTFVPGEKVTFTSEICNNTGKYIKTVVFALYAHVQYEGFTPSAERRRRADSSELLRQMANARIPAFNSTTVVSAFNLPLVLSVSSGSQENEIMRSSYELVVTIHLPWSLSTVKARLPIIITSTREDKANCPQVDELAYEDQLV